MTKDEKWQVDAVVENEGFEYSFTSYSDFKEIKDKQFHKLRRAFVKAAEDLKEYIAVDEDEND